MECERSPFEILCELFPQIDIRLIKATVLEHGDDVESAIDFLVDTSDQIKDSSHSNVSKQKYLVDWDGNPAQTPFEVSMERDFTEMHLELVKDEQIRDLLSLVGEHSVTDFEHPKDEKDKDFLSLFSAHTENELGEDKSQVLDNLLNSDNKSSQLGVASVCDSSFDNRKTLFWERKLSSPHASTSSSIRSRISASDQISSIGSINGGYTGKSSTMLGEEMVNGGYNSDIQTSSWVGLRDMGLSSDVKCHQADFVSGDLFVVDNVSHSFHENASASGIINSNSCQNVSAKFLEDVIQEARTDKEFLTQFIETISTLQAIVDQENIAAQRSKMDAVRGGQDILVKAEEIRKQTSKMREDNLMRAGEIYGEKAVLSTEARELLSRLEQLKQQKDKAVSALGEIQAALQARLNTALEERERAEVEKKLKEENAMKILAMEEALLTTVITESKELDIEAEACTQLRGFLIEHGRIVDSLQGEMGILCEDVESFKNQVEEGMCSTVSTVSFPSGVTLKGPYIFRRSNRSTSSSSENLGQEILLEVHSDVKTSSQVSPTKEWNEENHASNCTYTYQSSHPSFYLGLREDPSIDFVSSVHAELEPSFDPSMPEPSFDVSEIKGREYDLDTNQLKSVVESDGNLELEGFCNNYGNCSNGPTNNVYEIRGPAKQSISNGDMGSGVDKLDFENSAGIAPFNDMSTPVSVQKKASSEKVHVKKGASSSNSQSDDNDWDILCMEI